MQIIPIVPAAPRGHASSMDDSIRKLALRNAAKVALGSLFIGCGGTLSTADAQAPENSLDAALDHHDAEAAADAAVDASALACTATPIDVDAAIDAPTFECCLGVVEAVTGDADFFVADAGVVTSDPSIDNCCKAIIAHVNTNTSDYGAAASALPSCCNALQYPLSAACTPWGPPTPPAMETDLIDLTVRARPFSPAMSAPPHLRRAALATWHARMINEYASSRVFASLARQLDVCGFADDADEARAFANEERHHGVLCGAVVLALGGQATGELFAAPEFPCHRDAPPRAAVLRNVISICCLSETVAVALIGAERLEMPNGPLHDLLTAIWADEIGHARFGWRFLERIAPALTVSERSAVARYVPTALAHLDEHERAHLPKRHAPPGGEALGLCSGIDARRLLSETIDEVIAPRIQSLLS